MNAKGHPKTLVSAHPGNTNAVRHGAYSHRMIEPRAAEIEEQLLRGAELTTTEHIAAHEAARCMATLEAIDRDLAERGVVDRRGEARSLLDHRARMSRRLHTWLMVISPSIDRGSRRDDEEASSATQEYMAELTRIAQGHDPASTTHDRLTAMRMLRKLQQARAWHGHRGRVEHRLRPRP